MKKMLNRIYGKGFFNKREEVPILYPYDVASMYPIIPLRIKVKYLADITPIQRIPNGDWVDLRTSIEVRLKAGEYVAIPLGVAIQLPKGYEAIIAARSSTFKHYGLLQTNGIAVIDETYCGDNDQWHFPAYATHDVVIPKDTRICQFRLFKHQPTFSLIEVPTLGNKDRGGLGSTGKDGFTNYQY